MVNIREERPPEHIQPGPQQRPRVVYENPPVFLNFHILVVATHSSYANALLVLSRAIRFFQFKNVFDQDSVTPSSLTINAPANPLDQLETFKLIFDLYSPTMEEVNHLWGTLGGKQYPFVLYTLRLLELKFKAAQGEAGLITELVTTSIKRTRRRAEMTERTPAFTSACSKSGCCTITGWTTAQPSSTRSASAKRTRAFWLRCAPFLDVSRRRQPKRA